MNHHKTPLYFRALSFLTILMAAVAPMLFATQNVSAAGQITDRSLTLMAGAGGDGGSKPDGIVNHYFQFTIPSTTTPIGSIKFEYCTTAANSIISPTCVTPTGLNTNLVAPPDPANTTLGSELGSGATGFSLNKTTNGAPFLYKASAAAPLNGNLKFRLDNIHNPTDKAPFFVRITTYSTTTPTVGSEIDEGTVAAVINEQIILRGTMPESLVFCTGANISKTSGVPDCSTATSGLIWFDRLFSSTDTAMAISKMAATTNAGSGYAITVNGPTLTSGFNTIPGITTPSASTKGVAQFGLNLTTNSAAAAPGFPGTAPAISATIDLASNGSNLNGRATADYALADTFKFVTGDIVADSNYDATGNPEPTDAQIYTVSYIANVPGSQPAGTYTSTLTYICTATF